MKDIDQNLAIAKFHGWEEIRHNPNTDIWYGKPPKDAAHPWDVVISDYGKDLNAMHRVEVKLGDNRAFLYRGQVWQVVTGDEKWPDSSNASIRMHRMVWEATASQRREALLRTLSLWVEE